jgi:SHS2 domain-containing protein
MVKPYQAFEHTGDLGVEVWGDSWEALFAHASLALVDFLAEPSRIAPVEERRWSLQAEARDRLLIRQLEELLYQFDAQGMIFSEFEITMASPERLECRARGERFDRERHGFKTELKAVTYHGLKLWQDEAGLYRARIIFDV